MLFRSEGVWDKSKTVVFALDVLSLGELRFLDPEGEVVSYPVPPWLRETLLDVAASEPRFSSVRAFSPSVGATDAGPFLACGWDAVALTCIDPALGAARHYHQHSDTPENLDIEQVLLSIDFAEALGRRVMVDRGRG